ncbi:MAG: rRNA maturation RNase YbeY [Chitinophagales bacterium]
MADNNNSSIHFFVKDITLDLRNRRKLKDFVSFLFNNEKKKLKELDFIFCNDEFLLEINRKYLKQDNYTDVISFDLSNSSAEIMGEIYISLHRVKDNAVHLKQSFLTELHRVIFHGALHLCGYNDKSTGEQLKMRKKEEYYLNRYFGQVPRKTVS